MAERAKAPPLGPGEGSWVVVRTATGVVIGEFFDQRSIEKFNAEKVTVLTIGTYLAQYNARLREKGAAHGD